MGTRRYGVENNYKKDVIKIIVGSALVIVLMIIGNRQTDIYTKQEQLTLIENAIWQAAVECYAIEGVYPPNVQYIEEKYGVAIDEKKYIVHYEIVGSNIMPSITVLNKGGN